MKKPKKEGNKNNNNKINRYLREIFRDIKALGSIPFYILVLVRLMVGPYRDFVYKLVIAAIVLFILFLVYKKSDFYIARAFILGLFTSLFYNNLPYAIIVSVLFAILFFSQIYLKKPIKQLILGLFFGIISSAIAHYVVLKFYI